MSQDFMNWWKSSRLYENHRVEKLINNGGMKYSKIEDRIRYKMIAKWISINWTRFFKEQLTNSISYNKISY